MAGWMDGSSIVTVNNANAMYSQPCNNTVADVFLLN